MGMSEFDCACCCDISSKKTPFRENFSVIPGFQGPLANGWHLDALQQWREI
jgi:hypothetical protein